MKHILFKRSAWANPSALYIFINILGSTVGFGRSYFFMRWLDTSDLGIISLVQTIIMFLGMFQIGLLNGGYRIFALGKKAQQQNVNNVLFTFFSLLAGITLIFWLILVLSGGKIIISNSLMFVSIVIGLLTLIMNWLVNVLIGKQLIRNINQINLIAIIASCILLPMIITGGFVGAIVNLVVQPLLFIVIALLKFKDLRPTAWNFDIKLVRYILSFGFIPFLAGIFNVLNLQIERWSIANILGTKALGEFYLVFLYTTLFILIPTSLSNLFFPKAIFAYENNDITTFAKLIKKHFFLLGGYLFFIVLFTVFVLQFFIDLLLPKYSNDVIYVYYFLPGLVALVLCDPISIILNATVRLKLFLYAGGFGVILNIILIYIVNSQGIFSLVYMSWIKTLINVTSLVMYFFYIVVKYNVIFKRIKC